MDEELFSKAKKRAMYLLGARDHSKAELEKKLLQNYPEDICEAVINWVDGYGYLDDEKYAVKLARQMIINKHYGLRKVRYDLKIKGIDEEIIEAVLSSYENDQIVDEIKKYIEKKYSDRLDDRKEVEKVIAALARRGYNYDDIKTAIYKINNDAEVEYE